MFEVREGYELNGEYGRFHSVDYPNYDACVWGCGNTRSYCENLAEGCTYVDEYADAADQAAQFHTHALRRFHNGDRKWVGDDDKNPTPPAARELIETTTDVDGCPDCGQITRMEYRHYSDGSTVALSGCVCSA